MAQIKALILDYGEVLCFRPQASDLQKIARFFHLDLRKFQSLYSESRDLYDQGLINGDEYWADFARKAGTTLAESDLQHIQALDIAAWSQTNPRMIEWLQAVHNFGMPTALLSNMTHDMKPYMLANFAWLSAFDHLVFSCDLKQIKPHPPIYLHCLQKLRSSAEETLFIDDRRINIQGAREIGLQAVLFEGMDKLRHDLEAMNFPVLPPASSTQMQNHNLLQNL